MPVYLDYNATTPPDPEVRAAMLAGFDEAWANPSSIHQLGRHARALLDDARERAAAVLSCKPSELTFTSGGTESNNAALFSAARLRRERGRHLICSLVEHPAVLAAFRQLASGEGFDLTLLPPDSSGEVCPEVVAAALRSDTILVSVMAANNEIGRHQRFREIGELCRARGILYHCDAVQWFGKETFAGVEAFGADLVPLCGHKFHGPRGAGLLYARSPLILPPFLVGGSQEGDRRAGTENLPAILGLVVAMERFLRPPVFDRRLLAGWADAVRRTLAELPGVRLFEAGPASLVNTVAFAVEGTDSMALLANLDLAGFCASSGSACSAGSVEPSHVLLAMGVSRDLASSLIRISLGRGNTESEIAALCVALPEVVRRARSC